MIVQKNKYKFPEIFIVAEYCFEIISIPEDVSILNIVVTEDGGRGGF